MDPFNHNDTNPLRSTDLMIAYLEDRAGEEDILKIEQLLESDSLYRLSMEQLADQIADGHDQAKTRIETIELGFEEALDAAKSNFINQIGNAAEISDQAVSPGPAVPWWSFLVAIMLIGALAWTYLSSQAPTNFHKDPIENLVISSDQVVLNQFITDCGGAGIGRQKSASVYSALVEQFAEGRYPAAAQQLESLSASLSDPCKGYAAFYQGQSYLGMKDYGKAEQAFEKVLGIQGLSLELKHASLWFLANLQLVRGATSEAEAHLEALQTSAETNTQAHIQELMDREYLLDTELYLNDL